MTQPDDAALVASVRRGNLNAFEALYDRYKTMVFRTAFGITRDSSAAEEVTQECFVRAYRNMERVDTRTSLGPWLHRIASNLSYNWWRVARHRWHVPLESAAENPDSGDHDRTVVAAQSNESTHAIMEALQALPFEQRVPLILFYLNGFTLDEIAYVLDCPVGTIKSRLHYGRVSLKRSLGHIWEPEVAYGY